MIDWHSHILPCVDDGSKSIAESVAMINMLLEQGVDTVIATPHFSANSEPVDSFIKRRNEAKEKIKNETSINILLGAEVKFYPGISKMTGLEKLCIEGTNLLMIEMPMAKWTEYTVRELVDLSSSAGVRLILAHIERYLPFQNSDVWNRLYEAGVLMQVNASYFIEFFSRRKAISLLNDGNIHLIGSDCHNTEHRPPRMAEAIEFIEKKLGGKIIIRLEEYWNSLLTK